MVAGGRKEDKTLCFYCFFRGRHLPLVGGGSSIPTSSAGALFSGTGLFDSSGALKTSGNVVRCGAKSAKPMHSYSLPSGIKI
jgi:hypothetical protein